VKILIDASAIAKGLLREPDWDRAHGFLHGTDPLYASRLAYPETRSALTRARGTGRVKAEDFRALVATFDRRWRQIVVVELTERVARTAGDVAERYGLRAGDAVHLASALVLEDPELTLATWDRRLAAAASAAGVPVTPPL
jgi:predicted nucleic acid-binding protein